MFSVMSKESSQNEHPGVSLRAGHRENRPAVRAILPGVPGLTI